MCSFVFWPEQLSIPGHTQSRSPNSQISSAGIGTEADIRYRCTDPYQPRRTRLFLSHDMHGCPHLQPLPSGCGGHELPAQDVWLIPSHRNGAIYASSTVATTLTLVMQKFTSYPLGRHSVHHLNLTALPMQNPEARVALPSLTDASRLRVVSSIILAHRPFPTESHIGEAGTDTVCLCGFSTLGRGP